MCARECVLVELNIDNSIHKRLRLPTSVPYLAISKRNIWKETLLSNAHDTANNTDCARALSVKYMCTLSHFFFAFAELAKRHWMCNACIVYICFSVFFVLHAVAWIASARCCYYCLLCVSLYGSRMVCKNKTDDTMLITWSLFFERESNRTTTRNWMQQMYVRKRDLCYFIVFFYHSAAFFCFHFIYWNLYFSLAGFFPTSHWY